MGGGGLSRHPSTLGRTAVDGFIIFLHWASGQEDGGRIPHHSTLQVESSFLYTEGQCDDDFCRGCRGSVMF